MYLVERTCTKIFANESDDQIAVRPQPLAHYKNLSAYILLGDPGAGKTTAFEQEADRSDAFYVTARNLITFEDRPEWHKKTLFIDGLDEMRAGSMDNRTPLDKIRACLNKLGCPRFRLSCREADWLGASDQERLKSVSPDGQVTVLHIDSLTEADIIEILKHNHRVPNTEEFMQQAKRRGLNKLLNNPQVLDMLTKAVTGGNWPNTRKQTFELACQTIIREHNQEHIDATRTQPVDEKQQLNAAGFLCAVQLIAGIAGYALKPNMANSDFPYIGDPSLAYDNIDALNGVAQTKLFKVSARQIVPVHRHVAEYLAALYLADCIKSGLPITRILALITGEDGVVVAKLRGLSAWLAAVCDTQRSAIIEHDPLGVVLYGDVQDFTVEDKRRVLDGLQIEAARYPWFRLSHWITSPFGALATPNMEKEFQKILTAPDRSETHQALADCVLDAMAHGDEFPSLDDMLLDIVRDATWGPRIRQQALRVILRHNKNNLVSLIRLKALLDEINNGTLEDPDDELMGHLLTLLYPKSIPAAEVLNYLHSPKQQDFGYYQWFWRDKLLDQSSGFDISVILDELAALLNNSRSTLDPYFRNLPIGLLARGLEVYGTSIKSMRLYGWLGVSLDENGHLHSGEHAHSDTIRIRLWLEAHPAIQNAIIGIGLAYCTEKENFRYCMNTVYGRWHGAKPPANFGRWCLKRMQAETNNSVARHLLKMAVDTGLPLETIEKVTDRQPKYKAWLNEMRDFRVADLKALESTKKPSLHDTERHEKKQQWLRRAKSHESKLREGNASPNLLYYLAKIYFGDLVDAKGDTPIERLRNFLDYDEDLVQAAVEGLLSSLERDDIPKVDDIIQLYVNDELYLLSLPILAGMKEIAQTSPSDVLRLSDKQIRQVLAFYLTRGVGENPDWYKLLLDSHSDLVTEVLIAYVYAALHSKKPHITGLHLLAYNDAHHSVAKSASLIMLKTFPARSTSQQLIWLDELLMAALRYANRKALLTLIEKKLKLKSMNPGQRIRWLAAGLIVAPEIFFEPLANFTKGWEQGIQHLADFFSGRHGQWSPLDDLSIKVLGLLVRLIGEFFAPYTRTGQVTPAMNAADLVKNRLIHRMGSRPEKEASDMLDDLLANTELCRWHPRLRQARYEQRAARREASFRHPDIYQVSKTLDNQSPANAGDLAALVTDVLQELAKRIRDGNTDDYRQYWNEATGPGRKLKTPRHEDTCRNALLSDLQQRLKPFGIDAQPEAHYADDKRADIRIAFGDFEVPVEIKKNVHRDLWHAIKDQLIAKYTREPRTQGFGIYLVFWFGPDKTPPPPSGQRPRTADELEKRLRATLSTDERRKISICVIDVAKPESGSIKE